MFEEEKPVYHYFLRIMDGEPRVYRKDISKVRRCMGIHSCLPFSIQVVQKSDIIWNLTTKERIKDRNMGGGYPLSDAEIRVWQNIKYYKV